MSHEYTENFCGKNFAKLFSYAKKGEDGDNIVVSLSNSNLAYIVNGKQEDPVEERPFDFCFVLDKIFKSWMNVGLIPFTRECMKHPKVCHLLGEGGSNEGETQSKLQHLLVKYENIKQKVREAGLNADVFNAIIPVYKKNYLLQKTEDEQVSCKKEGCIQAQRHVGLPWDKDVGIEGYHPRTSSPVTGRIRSKGGCKKEENK